MVCKRKIPHKHRMKPASFMPAAAISLLAGALAANAQAIVQITSSDEVSFFVKSDGSLWRGDRTHQIAGWREQMAGATREFQQHPQSSQTMAKMRALGEHLTASNFEPIDLIVSNGVMAAAMNLQGDTFFIKDDGSLWAMGKNEGGYLGDGTFIRPAHPIQIVASGVKAVACGEDFTIFLKNDSSVWGFGWSGDGELGLENEMLARPQPIITGGVAAIAAGYLHWLFIKTDGSLWGLGNNGYGQLGQGKQLNHTHVPVEIAGSNVVTIAAAHGHSLFIKGDGSLWAMGLNDWGQIGDCTIDWPYHPEQIVPDKVVAIAAGYSGSLFLKQDGSLWGMGINWNSDYGEGVEFNSKCPTQIFAGDHSALLAGYYYNAQLKTCASLWAGKFNQGLAGAGSVSDQSGQKSQVANLPGVNLITIELLKDGDVRLTYPGEAGVNYAVERSTSLVNPNWISEVTNTAPSDGMLVVTNTPNIRVNNFWRIRSVPQASRPSHSVHQPE